jgi:cell division protein FtsA
MIVRDRSDKGASEIVGLLDIGTSKVACLIAAIDVGQGSGAASRARLLGVGHVCSRGIKGGVIVDLSEAEAAVRAAIAQAERAARVTLEDVFVSVSCGRLQSSNFAASVDVAGGVVQATDVERLMSGGRSWAERDGRMLIHLNRIGFRLDGVAGGNDPRGMAAARLSADLHTVGADEAPIRNLLHVVERCYLSVRALIAAPYASAIAVTSEEERRLGVTCIDIGGGTATVAVFAEGHFIHAAAVPVGGHHITFDIAHALQTPLAEAERIKTLYGTMVVARSDEHDVFSYAFAREDEGTSGRSTKAHLAAFIRPRVANILELVRERLDLAGLGAFASERMVLTGGTSGLVGIGEFAANMLGRPVRVAKPHQVELPPNCSSAAFATVAGLLAVASAGGQEALAWSHAGADGTGYLERVGQWLKAGFA